MTPIERLARQLCIERGIDPDWLETVGPFWEPRQEPRWKGYLGRADQLLAIPEIERRALVAAMQEEAR